MNYFVCTYGNFPEREELFRRSLEEQCYFLHSGARWPTAIEEIRCGDTLMLNSWGCIMAIGTAISGVEETFSESGWKYRVRVEKWNSYDPKNMQRGYSSYGIHDATLMGGQFSLVKKVNSKWAIRQVDEMRMLSYLGVMKQNCFQLRVGNIASWFYDDIINGAGVEAGIPILQRGLVWNAQQDELLWDSLMRKIPIGALVLCPAISAQSKGEACTHHILDGQQRCNAIALGFDNIPFKNEGEKRSNKRILWCDLCADNDLLATTSRKYLIRVTTPAHPWGYRVSDNSGSDACLDVSQIRDAINLIKQEQGKNIGFGERERPHTSEIYPLAPCARLPIPMGFLTRSYLAIEGDGDIQHKFWNGVKTELEKADFPFLKLKGRLLEFIDSDTDKNKEFRRRIFSGIRNAMEYVIVAVNAPQEVIDGDATSDGQDTVEHLFTRINRQGTRLDGEELIYSSIKAYWPQIQTSIDEVAKKRMPSSRLLRLALQVSETERKRHYVRGISLSEVRKIAKEPRGRAAEIFIDKELGCLCEIVDRWLILDDNGGVPRVLKTAIAHNAPELYAFLLLLAWKNHRIDRSFIVSLALYLYFYDYKKRNTRRINVVDQIIIDCYQGSFSEDVIVKAIKSCQNRLGDDPWLLTVVNLEERVRGGLDDVQFRVDSLPEGLDWWPCFERFRCNRDLLLFAEGEYIEKTFPDYDPALKEMWVEHNRPWDYDHIVPQDVVNKWDEQGANSWWLWCIGNFAAIPLEENRRKNKNPSWDYYDGQKSTYPILNVDGFKRFVDFKVNLVDFRRQVWNRFLNIYCKLYEKVRLFE